MSKFFVGQRVTVARSSDGLGHGGAHDPLVIPNAIGRMTAVIEGTAQHPNAGFHAHGAWDVSIRLETGQLGMAPSCCLEPATDANDKIEWSECIWAPDNAKEATA